VTETLWDICKNNFGTIIIGSLLEIVTVPLKIIYQILSLPLRFILIFY